MNIKQAEAETGISRRNIRFYEAQGLLRPQRNADNSYREYTDEDIRTLKLIRMLRMTDMPLEEIRGILSGSCPLSVTAARHKERLIRRQEELLGAIRLCDGLQGQQIQTLDIDQVLARAAAPQKEGGGFFTGWINDYKEFAKAQHELRFTFSPTARSPRPRSFPKHCLPMPKNTAWIWSSQRKACIRSSPLTVCPLPPSATIPTCRAFL